MAAATLRCPTSPSWTRPRTGPQSTPSSRPSCITCARSTLGRHRSNPRGATPIPNTTDACRRPSKSSNSKGSSPRTVRGPGKYQAWVRFSNAIKVRNDLDRDARGMAIKVMGVPGGASEGTQDFLLVTHRSFFARTPADFVDFPAAVAGAGQSVALFSRNLRVLLRMASLQVSATEASSR